MQRHRIEGPVACVMTNVIVNERTALTLMVRLQAMLQRRRVPKRTDPGRAVHGLDSHSNTAHGR